MHHMNTFVRQEKLGKGGSHKRKPFVGTLRVTSPVRQSLASGRKRVLRGVRATGAAKRRQRVSGPCDGAPKAFIVAGADVLKVTEGRVAAPQWPGAGDPAGV